MTDPILAQSNWEHSAVDDEAAVFFDDSYVHEIQLTIDDPNWYNILITLMILMLMAQTRISKLTSQRTVLCLRPRKVRIMLASH